MDGAHRVGVAKFWYGAEAGAAFIDACRGTFMVPEIAGIATLPASMSCRKSNPHREAAGPVERIAGLLAI